MRVGVLSDVHIHRPEHAADVEVLVRRIRATTNLDLLLCAGDISHKPDEAKRFLSSLSSDVPRAWVPGNHDIWVLNEAEADSAERRYRSLLPALSKETGWHYLPDAPLLLSGHRIAVVGTIGWSADIRFSEWFDRQAGEADEQLAIGFAKDLEDAIVRTPSDHGLIVVTHHPPHPVCLVDPPGTQRSPARHGGVNAHVAEVLRRCAERVRLVIHGHHHRHRENRADGLWFVAHPFGYPGEHASVEDGLRTVEVSA